MAGQGDARQVGTTRQSGDDERWTGGPVLEMHRRRLGLTFGQLADSAGLSRSYVHRLANNPGVNPGVLTLARLARALDIPVDALLGVQASDRYSSGYTAGVTQARDLIRRSFAACEATMTDLIQELTDGD